MATVVVVGGDLMARSRIEGAASATGAEVVRARADDMVEVVTQRRPDLLVLDLDGGRDKVLEGLKALRETGAAPARAVGYFSHVDEQLGRAARAAGCEPLPRGRFWRDLPELLAGLEDKQRP